MAVRVRKLARELKRSPAEVLGLLHHLGYTRYKSSEDMIADPVATKARRAARDGIRVAPVSPAAERKGPTRGTKAAKAADVMASLVPGVAPLGSKAPAAHPGPVVVPAPAPSPKPAPEAAPVPRPEPAVQALEREVAELRAALEQERAERTAAGAEIERLRGELAQASTEPSAQGGGSLAALLEARGLRGADEHARALEALFARRQLDPARLMPTHPDDVARLLAERVVTFDGRVPTGLGNAVGVSVSPDRADAPGEERLRKGIGRVGEQLMLCGFTRLRAVGVPPIWHGPLRNLMDSRIDLHLSPGGSRDGARARSDVEGVDVVWLWGVEGDEEADAAWAEASVLVRGPADPGGAIDALVAGLAAL